MFAGASRHARSSVWRAAPAGRIVRLGRAAAVVANEVRLPVRPCSMRGSYSIYTGPQAHLDIHRDVRGCDLALVTCLYDSDPFAGEGAVDLWLDDLTTPLGEIRAHLERRRNRFASASG